MNNNVLEYHNDDFIMHNKNKLEQFGFIFCENRKCILPNGWEIITNDKDPKQQICYDNNDRIVFTFYYNSMNLSWKNLRKNKSNSFIKIIRKII